MEGVSTTRESPTLVAIGHKIRHWRRVKGMTLLELAERVGCSESLLSKIENDKVRPSVRILHQLVAALETNVGMLFQEDGPDGDIVLRASERLCINVPGPAGGGGAQLESLIPGAASRLLQATLHAIQPGGGSDGVIEHVGEEVGYVLEGRLELTVAGRTLVVEAGDSFHFRSNLPHAYRNPSSAGVTRVLWVNTPPTF